MTNQELVNQFLNCMWYSFNKVKLKKNTLKKKNKPKGPSSKSRVINSSCSTYIPFIHYSSFHQNDYLELNEIYTYVLSHMKKNKSPFPLISQTDDTADAEWIRNDFLFMLHDERRSSRWKEESVLETQVVSVFNLIRS